MSVCLRVCTAAIEMIESHNLSDKFHHWTLIDRHHLTKCGNINMLLPVATTLDNMIAMTIYMRWKRLHQIVSQWI